MILKEYIMKLLYSLYSFLYYKLKYDIKESWLPLSKINSNILIEWIEWIEWINK